MSRKGKWSKPSLKKQELYRLILDLVFQHSNESVDYKKISKLLGVRDMGGKRLIHEVLYELADDGLLTEISTGKFKAGVVPPYVTGVLELISKGRAFVRSEEGKEDIFIPQSGLNHALDGDRVLVLVYARSRGKHPEGEIITILERKRENFVGVIRLSPLSAFLVPAGRQIPYGIFIPFNKLHGAKDGEKAIVKIIEWTDEQKNPVGEVLEVLGESGDNDTEMHAIMAEFELPVDFPPEVEAAANEIPESIPEEAYQKRRDFREVVTFTIDPKDAKDFDDALSIRKLPNGNMEVGVHIADVSHYVRPHSLLDKEAYKRATSVYLVDRTIPMLPERLSNGLCSLRPNEEKLCFSAVFELNERAEVLRQWFGRTVIRSNRRFTYEEAQAIIEGADGDFREEILCLHALAQQLRAVRFQDGAINFNHVEVRFELDEKGHPVGVYCKESKEANQLIEEFMLLANRKVAERVGKVATGEKAKTFVYRVHEQPNPEKLEDFGRVIAKFGYKLQMHSPRVLSSFMNRLMEEVKGRPEQNMIETLAIRTMAKAIYSTENIGHYGLAFDYYSHFTSPIRRYPDVMTHRLLQMYLDKEPSADSERYEEWCKHCSSMEQVASNAERTSIKYKQVEFMADRLGEEFLGTISGVSQSGFYVELNESKCEGMVPIAEIEGDYYEFDEENYCIVGRRHRRVYQLGDQVMIKVVKANLMTRQLEFALVGDEKTKPPVSRFGEKRVGERAPKERRRGRRGDAPIHHKSGKRRRRR